MEIKIEEGYTLDYLFTSVILFIIGGISLFINIFIGILVIVIAVLLLFVKTGTIIDEKRNRIGRYKSIMGKNNIQWTKISSFNKAYLGYKYTSQRMNSRGTSSVIKTKIYKLTLIGADKIIVFHEYSNYEISKQVLQALKDCFSFEIIDKYHEIQKNAYKRRMDRNIKR